MNNNRNNNPGCLSGLLSLFLVNKIYQWAQRTFGTGSGSCMGCGCGMVLFLIFIMVVVSIIFKVDWTSFSF